MQRAPRRFRALALAGLGVCLALPPAVFAAERDAAIDAPGSKRLPRYTEDHLRRAAPERLTPFAIRVAPQKTAPTTGVVRPHPEYAPMAGILFEYDRFGWPEIVTDMVAELTRPGFDEIAWVVVNDGAQRSHAQSAFAAAGADLAKVEFVTLPTDSIWIRDYGPQFVWLDDALAMVDLRYYTGRPADNFVPKLLADDVFGAPVYDLGLVHSGGNYLALGTGHGFTANIVTFFNQDYGHNRVVELFATYQGVHTLHVFPTLPGTVDATGHIDMWMQFADEDTVVIARFPPGENPTAITLTDNAAAYMQGLGFEVFRVPALNGDHPDQSETHFTYANSFRVNGRIFVPQYGSGGGAHQARDAQALAVWQQAAPGVEIVPIDAWELIYAAGALHCVVMHVPRYAAPDPAVTVLAPAGGEVLVSGEVAQVRWQASDDGAITDVDVFYSPDGDAPWSALAVGEADDGAQPFVVPHDVTDRARFRVAAHDGEGGTGVGISAGDVTVTSAVRRRWDFAANPGVNRWAWGHQTSGWFESVAGRRRPLGATTELSAADYADLATSNATGGDTDGNRYRSPTPATDNTSTHTFEFTVDADPALLLELELLWEGYADSCFQVELYVWDNVANEWCDGRGQCGQRRYMDNSSGNADQTLRGTIRDDFQRYIDPDGRVTFLVYAARPAQETFHDYVAVSLIRLEDTDADTVPDPTDCAPTDATSWATPGETTALTLSRSPAATHLNWTAPTDLGGTAVAYDLLATATATDFTTAACLVDSAPATGYDDAEPTAPGTLRAYLVRATNGCGPGTLGPAPAGPRPTPTCP